MNTKPIVDTEAALAHLKEQRGITMTQKELAAEIGTSVQNIISRQGKAPKVILDCIKTSEITGAPLDLIIKEVAK